MTAGGDGDKGRFGWKKSALLCASVVIAGSAAYFFHRRQEIAAEESFIPPVTLVSPSPGPAFDQIDLPANLAAWYDAPIFAQVSGYVKKWNTDFGAHVKQGEVLAEISTPGLDAEYAGAKAHYNVVLARYRLAKITAKRWSALQGTQAVSRQEVDVQEANAAAQKAELEAALHDVERYEALENFKKIVAPFDGLVISRLVNVGDYVNNVGGGMNARGGTGALFSVADIHKMRVFVSIPQDYAASISPKMSAELTFPQYPGQRFHADYLTTANAFDPATRNVTTELVLDNREGGLWPNAYATAHLKIPANPGVYTLPTSALIFRGDGVQVAVLKGNHVHLVPVELGINFGLTAQILSGLSLNDQIVATPPSDLLEGDQVKIVPTTRGYNAPALLTLSKKAPPPGSEAEQGRLRTLAALPQEALDAISAAKTGDRGKTDREKPAAK